MIRWSGSGVEDWQSRIINQGIRGLDPELLTGSVSPSVGKSQKDPLTGLQMSGMRHIL